MVKYQWGAAEAAPVSMILAFIIGVTMYKAPLDLIALESAKGIWNAITVIIVIWPAILVFEVTNEANAFDAFRKGMQKFSPNELLQIIAVGWVFASFLQGITGFGVPVAVAAPLLVGIGVTPLWAVVIALLGQAWAGTFGTLAVAWDALVLQTRLVDPILINNTALWAATFIWMFNFTTGMTICWWYGKKEAIKKGFLAVLIISLIHGGGQIILTQINQTLAAFVPACIALAAIFLIGKLKPYQKPWKIENSSVINRSLVRELVKTTEKEMTLNQAFVPYYALTSITLTILLIKPIKSFLDQWKIGFPFPQTITGYGFANPGTPMYAPMSPLIHSGLFLALAALIGYFYFRKNNYIKGGGLSRILLKTIEKTVPSTIAVVSLIIMSRIMGGTGQTIVLATGTALVTGSFYSLVAPAIGILGSFMTSSNMASNILFGEFQQTTANLLSMRLPAILGSQTAGGAMGNTISPGSVILGTTTAGIIGKEGLALKAILPITLSVAFVTGIILFIAHLI
jgi:lactate permease